jgi:hypothetical protein
MVTSIWLPAWSVLFIRGFIRWYPYQLTEPLPFVFKWRSLHQVSGAAVNLAGCAKRRGRIPAVVFDPDERQSSRVKRRAARRVAMKNEPAADVTPQSRIDAFDALSLAHGQRRMG